MATQQNQSCGTHDTAGSKKGWLSRHWKRIVTIMSGHGALAVINWIFNYPVYLFVLALVGLVWGYVAMTILTFLLNAAILWWYERGGIDWVGFSLLSDLEKKERKRLLERLLLWFHHRSETMVFVLLSLYWDPFIAVAYVHRGEFDKSKRAKHMKLVAIATVIANVWWTLRQGIILVGLLWIWHRLTGA